MPTPSVARYCELISHRTPACSAVRYASVLLYFTSLLVEKSNAVLNSGNAPTVPNSVTPSTTECWYFAAKPSKPSSG